MCNAWSTVVVFPLVRRVSSGSREEFAMTDGELSGHCALLRKLNLFISHLPCGCAGSSAACWLVIGSLICVLAVYELFWFLKLFHRHWQRSLKVYMDVFCDERIIVALWISCRRASTLHRHQYEKMCFKAQDMHRLNQLFKERPDRSLPRHRRHLLRQLWTSCWAHWTKVCVCVCLYHTWHIQWVRLSCQIRSPRSYMAGFAFLTQIWDCSVNTELINRNTGSSEG